MNPVLGGVITAHFDELRPLSAPSAQRSHVHGALDLAGGDGIVRAPTDGVAQGVVIFRGVDPRKGLGAWGAKGLEEKSEIMEFPWREYWYDVYGGFVVLYEPNGKMHLLCHVWPNRLLNPQPGPARYPFRFAYYIEEAEITRWPCHILMTDATEVRQGQPLAPVGTAGYSTGAHVHWEIHHTSKAIDYYSVRINPKEYMR